MEEAAIGKFVDGRSGVVIAFVRQDEMISDNLHFLHVCDGLRRSDVVRSVLGAKGFNGLRDLLDDVHVVCGKMIKTIAAPFVVCGDMDYVANAAKGPNMFTLIMQFAPPIGSVRSNSHGWRDAVLKTRWQTFLT